MKSKLQEGAVQVCVYCTYVLLKDNTNVVAKSNNCRKVVDSFPKRDKFAFPAASFIFFNPLGHPVNLANPPGQVVLKSVI